MNRRTFFEGLLGSLLSIPIFGFFQPTKNVEDFEGLQRVIDNSECGFDIVVKEPCPHYNNSQPVDLFLNGHWADRCQLQFSIPYIPFYAKEPIRIETIEIKDMNGICLIDAKGFSPINMGEGDSLILTLGDVW